MRDVRAHLGKKQFEKEGLPFELFLSENKDIYLLSLLDTLKKAQECQESVEQEKLLQMLTVLCVRPSFLFGSTPKMQSTSKNNLDDEDQQRAVWKKYRKEIITVSIVPFVITFRISVYTAALAYLSMTQSSLNPVAHHRGKRSLR